jgi:hypothetical protein
MRLCATHTPSGLLHKKSVTQSLSEAESCSATQNNYRFLLLHPKADCHVRDSMPLVLTSARLIHPAISLYIYINSETKSIGNIISNKM